MLKQAKIPRTFKMPRNCFMTSCKIIASKFQICGHPVWAGAISRSIWMCILLFWDGDILNFPTNIIFSYAKHARLRSKFKAASAKNYKAENAKSHHDRGVGSKGQSFGQSPAKGLGPGTGRGLALGHSKGKIGITPAG